MSRPADQGRDVAVSQIDWRGHTIRITYEADWLGMNARRGHYSTAHLQIETLAPERAPLPMTETGYRSYFTDRAVIEDAGGPDAFVLAWLEHEAAKPAWKAREAQARQLSLF